jgi:hypothetical protein
VPQSVDRKEGSYKKKTKKQRWEEEGREGNRDRKNPRVKKGRNERTREDNRGSNKEQRQKGVPVTAF